MERLGCLRLFVIATGISEIVVVVGILNLVVERLGPAELGNTAAKGMMIGIIAFCLIIPTAATAHAYLAESQRGIVLALAILIGFPIVLISLPVLVG